MLDQRQIRKLLDEIGETPDATSILVEAEIRRIRSAIITSGKQDCEDLITYAKSIVAMRHQIATLETALSYQSGNGEGRDNG